MHNMDNTMDTQQKLTKAQENEVCGGWNGGHGWEITCSEGRLNELEYIGVKTKKGKKGKQTYYFEDANGTEHKMPNKAVDAFHTVLAKLIDETRDHRNGK